MKLVLTTLCFLILGFNSLNGQNNRELAITFSKIDSSLFNKHKESIPHAIIIDSTKKAIPGSSFSLKINNSEQSFNCKKDFSDCFYYKGFLTTINSYVITHCGSYTCETYLINQSSGKIQDIPNPYDSESNSPILSEDENKMLVYASSVFDKESFICVLQRTNNTEEFNTKSYESLFIKEWRILEAIWITNHSFAIKTFDEYGGNTGSEPLNVKYFQGVLK